MGGFFRRRDRDGQDRWWLAITGKGDKERSLPATTELMAELTRYRRHYDLAALPYGGETTPLLLPIGGTHRTMSRGAVHLIIKQVFDNAIDRLQSTGEAQKHATERSRQASALWLRHTTRSRMMDGQPYVSRDRHHRVSEKRRHAGERGGHGQLRVNAHDSTL